MVDVNDTSSRRREVLAGAGASGAVLDELLAYNENRFDASRFHGQRFPLPDEPHIEAWREYAADASAARLVGHPYGLASALEKLGAYNKRIPMNVPPATSSLFIVAPLSAGQVFSSLFSTHPPLEKRIAALRQMVVSQ